MQYRTPGKIGMFHNHAVTSRIISLLEKYFLWENWCILFPMQLKSPPSYSPQPQLFLIEESIGNIELFPTVWGALEDFTNPDLELRREALQSLIDLDAARYSPVVAYFLVSKITEQDLDLRSQIIETIGRVLSPDENGYPAPQEVRSSIHLYLSSFRTRQIFALLEASAEDKSLEGCVSRLLDACPYAGNHLIDLLIDRKIPLDVRKQAAKMIGSVGYLDALPALERLHSRLESRIYGQKAMPFAPEESDIEAELLPVIHEALNFLRAP